MLSTAAAILTPLAAMGASIALAILILERHRRASERGLCRQCGYDLAGIDATVCPECGHRTHATVTAGHAALAAEVLAIPAAAAFQALVIPMGLGLVRGLGLGPGLTAPALALVMSAVMIASVGLLAAAFTVRRAPKELVCVMLVYVVGAADTGITWFLVVMAPG